MARRKRRDEEYSELYQTNFEDSTEEQIESLRSTSITNIRVKTIKSGSMLESEIYPLHRIKPGLRNKKKGTSTNAQKNLNDKNAKKKLIRLIHSNFDNKGMWATFSYDEQHKPGSMDEALRCMQNYIRRLKRYIKKNNLPELKYIYVTEFEEGKTRAHHHMIMNFEDRDMAEKIWTCGARKQTRRLQPDDFGLEGLARYISKDPRNSKRYNCSRNLKKPVVTVADHKLSRRDVQKIVRGEVDAEQFFSKMYKKYKFNDLKITLSEFTSGAYLYARMKRMET